MRGKCGQKVRVNKHKVGGSQLARGTSSYVPFFPPFLPYSHNILFNQASATATFSTDEQMWQYTGHITFFSSRIRPDLAREA